MCTRDKNISLIKQKQNPRNRQQSKALNKKAEVQCVLQYWMVILFLRKNIMWLMFSSFTSCKQRVKMLICWGFFFFFLDMSDNKPTTFHFPR